MDIERLFNGPNIQQFMRSRRLEWAVHVWQAKRSIIRRALVNNPNKERPRGSSRQRRWAE